MARCGTTTGYGRGCRCVECKAARKAADLRRRSRRKGEGYLADAPHRVSAEPVRRLIELAGGLKRAGRLMADRYGGLATSHERRLARAMTAATLTVYAADEICVAFGHHPFEIYGHALYADLEGASDVA